MIDGSIIGENVTKQENISYICGYNLFCFVT